MRKSLNICILLILALSCSEDDSDNPINQTPEICESILDSGITFSSEFVYTRDLFIIEGIKFCAEDIVAALVNDTEVSLTGNIEPTKLSFLIPTITSDSATLKIKTKTSVIDLNKKIAVYPRGGRTSEVAPFTGLERGNGFSMNLDGKGYLVGGDHFESFNSVISYEDLYSYDPVSNTWTLENTDPRFKNPRAGMGVDGKLFLFGSPNGNVNVYDVISKTFTQTKANGSGDIISTTGFSIGGTAYSCSNNGYVSMLIKKYDPSLNEWLTVIEEATGNLGEFSFSFEHNDKAYIGTIVINSHTVRLWSFDPILNEVKLIDEIVTNPVRVGFLSYLFTIDELSYFNESGESSVYPDKATVIRGPIFIYNHKEAEWKLTTSGGLHGHISFSLNNRGYMGLGVSGGETILNSSKFYEFIPE